MAEKKQSKADKLKEINEKKKKLNEEQRKIKQELNEGKEERIAARKAMAAARKESKVQRTELRNTMMSINTVFSEGDSEAVEKLADSIMEISANLAKAVRDFGKANDDLIGL